MNKEEILKNINEMIELIDDECYLSIPEDIESIKGLLDLYNKEKEKNEMRRYNEIEQTKGLLKLYNQEKEKNKELEKEYDKLAKYFTENHISKDKIKDKIKEIKETEDLLKEN